MTHDTFTLQPINDTACAVLDAQGRHVGNLKRIGAVWKFKAVGYTERANGSPVAGR